VQVHACPSLSENDMLNVSVFAIHIVSLADYCKLLMSYLMEKMNLVALSLMALLGGEDWYKGFDLVYFIIITAVCK
jgi:RNA processing factor Prp31